MGELTPGTPLRLEDLARQLGMSISPIREAVRQLEALGLAEHVPHHGAKVMRLDVEELRELFSIRLALEGMAVRRAAALFDEANAQSARAHLTAYDDARHRGDIRAAVRAHGSFHFTLYSASGSEWLVRLIRPAWENSERYRALATPSSEVIRARQLEHERILEACASGDGETAARELRSHLEQTVHVVGAQLVARTTAASAS